MGTVRLYQFSFYPICVKFIVFTPLKANLEAIFPTFFSNLLLLSILNRRFASLNKRRKEDLDLLDSGSM